MGNSRANGQVERTIRTIKDILRRQLTEHPDSYWSDHLPTALLVLRLTIHKAINLPPFMVVTGTTATPPSYLLEDIE